MIHKSVNNLYLMIYIVPRIIPILCWHILFANTQPTAELHSGYTALAQNDTRLMHMNVN